MTFLWALFATAVLVGVGVVSLFVLNDKLQFSDVFQQSTTAAASQQASPPATAKPIVDPSLSVTILNGTTENGLASRVGEGLAKDGWTIGSQSNADTNTVKVTTVYYSDAAHEGAARGLAKALHNATVLLSSDFADTGAQLTAVLGSDYSEG